MLMEEHLGTITQKGQVTIPLAIRMILGVKSRDRVAFRVIEGRVELAPATMSLEDTYGAVKPTARPENWSGIRSRVREERVGLRTGKTIRPRKKGR
jgi:AbrB family looped-hinge helix DNA binding protein